MNIENKMHMNKQVSEAGTGEPLVKKKLQLEYFLSYALNEGTTKLFSNFWFKYIFSFKNIFYVNGFWESYMLSDLNYGTLLFLLFQLDVMPWSDEDSIQLTCFMKIMNTKWIDYYIKLFMFYLYTRRHRYNVWHTNVCY